MQALPITTSAVAIPRLGDQDISFVPQQTNFAQMVSDTVGNFGDSSDGIDSLILGLASDFTIDEPNIDPLLQTLAEMDFADGEIFDTLLSDSGSDLQSFLGNGDTLISAFNDAITPPDSSAGPQPPAAGPPPPTGAGGNPVAAPPTGAGDGGSIGVTCSLIIDPRTQEVLGQQCIPNESPGDEFPPPEVFRPGSRL